MYSGNDTVDYPTQWALNPVAYQDMANDQVDWAALAQQWIQMKETTPAPVVQVPPPPIISLSAIEGGEAPMDMEGGPEPPAPPTIPPQQWGNTPDPNWGNSWNQWGSWGWPSTPAAGSKPPLMPTPDPPYSGYSTGDNNFTGYTTGTGSNMAPGYWAGTTEEARSRAPRRHSPPAPRHTTRRPPRPHPSPVPPPGIIPEDTTQTIDAAKRRSLPAWIREGLEKMEREKQKQLDKEREQKEREEYLRLKKLEEERAGQEPDDGLPKLPAKSKFDSDSDGSDTESKMDKVAEKIDNETVKEPPPMLQKSQEEIMQDVMLNVRRTLTEILLEVTTEQILSVCKEELGRNRSHPQASLGASVASKSQALSAIGGGLGLGIYGDSSDSGSDSEESSSRTPERHQDEDITDGQLQDTIRRRKAEFEKTTREIEARIAEEEAQLQRAPSGGGPAPPPLSRHPRPAPPPPHSNAQESSASDGEGTTSNNRKEQNNSHHKKFIQENTPPPLVDGKKTKSVSEKTSRSERGSKDSIDKKIKTHNSIERKDKNSKKSYKEKERKHERDSSKKKVIKSPKKSSPDEQSDSEESSSESSGSSDSDTDSFLNDKPVAHSRRSRSSGSSNSGSSGGSSSSSDVRSVSQHSHSKKKKSKSSSERRKSKKSKKDKRKSKKEDRHKTKKVDTDDFDEVETPSRRRDHDYKRQDSVTRESHKSSRHSTRTPERVSHKSKYSHRSRSKSDDRSYKKYKKYDSREDDAHSRDRRSGERRDRSRDRRGRSREKRGRSREDRDWRDRSRGGRDRSKDRWERAREDRRDRKESRSYY